MADKAAAISKVMEMIKEHSVEYVDFRFTDPRGKWQHTAQHISTVDEDTFVDGIMFDGSSIAGWKAINESDMILMPDPVNACMDPFSAKPQLILFCDIIEPSTGQFYARDPRATAKLAEAYVASSGVGDSVLVGAEAEFFVFDSVRFGTGGNFASHFLESVEGPGSSMKEYPEGNMGHRPGVKGGYFPVAPVDGDVDLRAEMLSTMGEMGLPIEKHHHEVAQSQHELGTKFGTLTTMADQMQIYKYCVHNVAHSYGKTATFMPKPIYGDNGSGMHTHLSIWKEGKPLFAGNGYADLSELCLYAIGGIIKHAKAVNAFTNPSTNSYKRLIPGFEAPVLLAYSARNRSASCRIPYTTSPKAKRVEVRFPDASANPYLAYAALTMAAMDGIKNRIHPGDPMDKDLYDLPPEELKGIPTVCGSLREALGALEADHDFLLEGGVFSLDQIQSYIELKWSEVYRFEHTPHPVEFEMYYSV
ncbi:type I glutamate--ammonia ligase [Dankookia rubra]|uniref:Glutamine synthetase n=1 Tax=Dankookia rubra TaxID=1442381 RepID=A0A4R5QMC0_9PROT|nr:type I glutamate--ammonia ligase [Dankookia rubra]TDH64303.1 type I glutamate--ammonia ligase [Dankookia rubra]